MCLALTACDEGPKDPMSVGAKLPGGFKVDIRREFPSMDQCVAFARNNVKPQDVDSGSEINQPTMWVISVRKNTGFQTCMITHDGKVMFTEANKTD